MRPAAPAGGVRRPAVSLAPITADDLVEVGEFLHAELNPRVPAGAWAAMARPSWPAEPPNHGFCLRADGTVVGALLAFYTERIVRGRPERFCNLAAWCVADTHRAQGLRLLRAALAQEGWHFTDFSPSGNVVALNERLGFRHLDVTTYLVANLPLPGGARVLTAPHDIATALDGETLRHYLDHRWAAAARHLVLVHRDRPCLVTWRRVRRRDLPLFASVVHVSDREVFARGARSFYRHLLLREGVPATLLETRVAGPAPWHARRLASPRPRMFRSTTLSGADVDHLYSELTGVAW